jgi:peptidoglycan hydrolase-like protein with peptidoglycan-binding domain
MVKKASVDVPPIFEVSNNTNGIKSQNYLSLFSHKPEALRFAYRSCHVLKKCVLSLTLTFSTILIASPVLAVPFKKGDSGQEVGEIQRCLQKLGYFSGQITNNFGDVTEASVIKFQQANGFTGNGVVGPRTQALLESRCQAKKPPATPTPTPTSNALGIGSKGPAVSKLQEDLRKLDYFSGVVDGDFGPGTEASVTRFQRDRGIQPINGKVGPKTQAAIQEELKRISRRPSNPSNNPGSNICSNNQLPILRSGDKGPCVTKLQQLLKNWNLFNPALTDYFGKETQQAVIRFQQRRELLPNGIVDARTWLELQKPLTGPVSPPPQGCNRPVIYQGSQGQDVLDLQNKLNQLGYGKINATGYFGEQTTQSVTNFQRRNELIPNGVVDATTWKALGLNCQKPIPTTSTNSNSFIVIVPVTNNFTLEDVQLYVPSALVVRTRLGNVVQAGEFQDSPSAEKFTATLRSRGIDARIVPKSSL